MAGQRVRVTQLCLQLNSHSCEKELYFSFVFGKVAAAKEGTGSFHGRRAVCESLFSSEGFLPYLLIPYTLLI